MGERAGHRLLVIVAILVFGVVGVPPFVAAESEGSAPASQSISVVVPEGCRPEPVWSITAKLGPRSPRRSFERWIGDVVQAIVIADACRVGGSWSLSTQRNGAAPTRSTGLVTLTLLT